MTYTLCWDTMVEELTADELIDRMMGVQFNGWHIEKGNIFDFIVCFW